MAIFLQLLPVLLPIISPIITALIDKLLAKIGVPAPPDVLPIVNSATGIILSALTGASAETAVVAGPVGAMIGNRVREARNKRLAQAQT